MLPPSYARATASSSLKAAPTSPTLSISKTSLPTSSTPKKLKRPSTLTSHIRQSISYKSDLYPILPQDPTQPCPLANLPSELRSLIYEYILSSNLTLPQPQYILKPNSRVVFIAYTYYTSTPFEFRVRNFDFSTVKMWCDALPPRHRALLALNKYMTIRATPGLRYTYTYPPPNFLLDALMGTHWRNCNAYGNIYTIASQAQRIHFILFCRLMSWFQLNDSRGIEWRYMFDTVAMGLWDTGSKSDVLLAFLKDEVGVLGKSGARRMWTRRRDGRGKVEARVFLRDLDTAFGESEGHTKMEDAWDGEMRKLERAVAGW
jgi:hypothetical protein